MCHLWLPRERRRVCAVRICLSSKKSPILMLKMLCCPNLQFSRDVDCPDPGGHIVRSIRLYVAGFPRPCPPCMLTSSHFLNKYNSNNVSSDSQSLNKLSLKIKRGQTNTFAKEGLPGRAFFYRPMFCRNRHHHARADDSAGLPRLSVVLIAVTACIAEFKHHVGSVLLPSWF